MRALALKSLKASRDNRNRWQIELADLEEWAADRPMSKDNFRTVAEDMSRHDRDQIATVARLEAENCQLHERLDELRADRDAWRAQAERLASETRPAGIFFRIFGRR